MKTALKSFLTITHIGIAAVGVSMSLKAAIGVGAYDAFTQTLALLLNIKIGTFVIVLNSSLVFVQWLLLGKNFNLNRLFQIPVVFVLGSVVNYVYYTLFGNLLLPNYLYQLAFYLLGITLIAYGVGLIMALDFVSFPLESLCLVIADKIGWNFGRVRQAVDVVSILLALVLSFSFSLPLAIREGTLIGIVLFGFTVGWFYQNFQKTFRRVRLIES